MASTIPIKERLAKFISRVNGCWEWQGRITCQGYGQIGVGSRVDGSRRTRQAHTVSYETFVGKVPKGLVLDHTCRNRRCINPDHLEPVTAQENIRRSLPYRPFRIGMAVINANKTECKNGHLLDYVAPNGHRGCKTCRNTTAIKWQLARKVG